jgi:3D (Asp-Asp-Asp) domain-containing protein
MILEAILIGTMTATSYRATPAQTRPGCRSNSDCVTSIGENVSELGVAVSPDLLASGRLHYHDCIYIDGVGFRLINDTTNRRLRNSVDVFVYSKSEERKFGVRHLKVWVVKASSQNENRR